MDLACAAEATVPKLPITLGMEYMEDQNYVGEIQASTPTFPSKNL
jgi:hypothetical protein